MVPEKVLYTLLNADSGVTALAGTRIYSDARPEGDPLPAIVTALISDVPQGQLDNTVGLDLWTARVQANCLASTSEGAKTLAEAVITACHKRSGTIASVPVTAVLVDLRPPANYDPTVATYQQPVDFLIHYWR